MKDKNIKSNKKRHELERDIKKAITDYLKVKKFLVIQYRNVGIKKPNGQYIPVSDLGVSDILAVSPFGIFWAIEVKREGNKPSEYQSRFLEDVEKHHGIGIVAYSVDDVMREVEELSDMYITRG